MNLCMAGVPRFFTALNRFLGSFWTVLIVVIGCAFNVMVKDFLVGTFLRDWALAAYTLPPIFLLSVLASIKY